MAKTAVWIPGKGYIKTNTDPLWIPGAGYLEATEAAAGGLSIPIAAYHYNHNLGSNH